MQDVYDIRRVIKANDLCDRLGMDTISWGVTVAFARECYEKGLLTDENSPHFEFGDAEGLVELAKQTTHRDGFGDVLAEGSFRVAEQHQGIHDETTDGTAEFAPRSSTTRRSGTR